ncbi:hypothetical protein NKI88_26750 [Mesorhizobium sp. M0317]|uniref:hypothetical protein n=1 Tax=Mesorhizobium sp. M0317 TaxID=2956935 RepID=UPI003336C46B
MPDNGTDGLTDAQKTLKACAEILYWVNRCDLPQDRRRAACEAPLAVLLTHEAGTAVSCLRAIWHAFHSFELLEDHRSRKLGQEPVLISVASSFPEEVAEMCRACLKHPERQKGYFDYFELREALTPAISMLGQYGNLADIATLRQLAGLEQLGSSALDAIRCIEDRLMTARLAG